MEEYKVAVTTKLTSKGVLERMITVRADSIEEAEALYHEIQTRITTWDTQPTAEPTDSPDVDIPQCPKHHKAKEGKYGLFCPSKLKDGSWCSWRSAA